MKTSHKDSTAAKNLQAEIQTNQLLKPPLYFVNAWVDYALIGALSIVTFALLRSFHSGARTAFVYTFAAQLSWIVNWPHFSSTSYRLYHSKANIRQYPITALVVPWLLLAAVVCAFSAPYTFAPYLAKLFLIWSPYHFSGQTVGISMIYARRAGFQVNKFCRFALSSFIFGTSYLSQTIRAEINPAGYEYYGIKYPGFGLPAWMATASQYWMYIAGAIFLGFAVRWSLKNKKMLPPIVLLPAITQYVWFVRGSSWASFQEYVPFFHSLQYLLIAWSMQLKEKLDREKIEPSKKYVLSESARWGVINFVGGSLLFYFIPMLAAKIWGLPVLLSTGIFILGVQLHHFFVDGVVWKLKNKGVASPLLMNVSQLLPARKSMETPIRRAAALCLIATLCASQTSRAQNLSNIRPNLNFSNVTVPAETKAKLSNERAVLHTTAGDIVLAFYPEVAPETVAQLLKLMRLGVYDGTHFFRIENNFVAQLSTAYDRSVPLTAEQQAAIHPVKDEFSPFRHHRGTLSMAHGDAVNSGETSFSILLNDAPHLDGKYTVFGEVLQGMDVVNRFVAVPRQGTKPLVRLELNRAEVLATPNDLAKKVLVPAHAVAVPEAVIESQKSGGATPQTLVNVLLFIVFFGVLTFFAAKKIPLAMTQSLILVNVLVAFYFLMVALIPIGQKNQAVAVALFLGLLAIINLMGQFESPAAAPDSNPPKS